MVAQALFALGNYQQARTLNENTLARRRLMLGEDHPMAAHRIDSGLIDACGAGPDAREGVVSFLEKRPPKWPG